jgi:hypothetical protein
MHTGIVQEGAEQVPPFYCLYVVDLAWMMRAEQRCVVIYYAVFFCECQFMLLRPIGK